MLYSRTLLFIYLVYNSMHPLIPNSHSIPPHPPPLGGHQPVFCLWVSSCLWTILETETGVNKGELLFSHSVVSDSLWPCELQHARLPCLLPSPTAWWNSWPLSQWCHPTMLFSVIPFSSRLQSFPAWGVFPSEPVLRIRWPEYWIFSISFSFSISPSNEYWGRISFRMGRLNLLAV